jgi:hypothetical protein
MKNDKWKMENDPVLAKPQSESSCGVAKLAKHRIVNPAIEGSNPSATARSLPMANCQFPIGRLHEVESSHARSQSAIKIGNQQCIDPELE